MAEDLKGLIERINQEGIKAGQEKAQAIESQAQRRAEEIAQKANLEAERLLAEAKDKISRMQQSAKLSLEQAGRDLLLVLRKEINAMLDRLIAARLRQALSPKEMTRIISALIKSYSKKEKGDIIVSLKKQDLKSLEKGLMAELKEQLKKGITLKASEEISAGFVISYDSGKSYFDFTDKALTEYIGSYLQPKLAEILTGTTLQEKKTKKTKK